MTACAKLLLAERLTALAHEMRAVAGLMRECKPGWWYDRALNLDGSALFAADWAQQIEREALRPAAGPEPTPAPRPAGAPEWTPFDPEASCS